MMKRVCYTIIIGTLFSFFSQSYAQELRKEITIDKWLFKAFDPVNAQEVSLPHSWVTETKLRKLVYENAWYSSMVNPGETDGKRRAYLYFERVSINATVYVNSHLAGTHKGPMTAFIFDITDLLLSGKENLIEVKVDNSHDPQSMPANYFGGILGSVKLIFTDEIHIDPQYFASSGIFIIPDTVTKEAAHFKVQTRIRNSSLQIETVLVKNMLLKDLKILARKETIVEIDKNNTSVAVTNMTLDNPDLWSPDSPSLYTLNTEVWVDGKIRDKLTETTGFRNFRITSDDIWLNGGAIKLYGVNYTHPSNEIEGAAISNSSIRADLDDIRYTLGCNSVRFAHWPFPEVAYEHADSIGLIVLTENGYAWFEEIEIGPEGDRLTREMVYQNFNHPSIFFWSSGNENPHEGYIHYASVIRAADSSRIIVCVDDKGCFPIRNHDAVFQNKYPGWYWRSPWDIGNFTREIHLIGETGAGSIRTNHQPYSITDFERGKFEPEEWAQLICEAIFQTCFVNAPEQIDAIYIWQYRDIFSGKYKGYNTKGLIAAGQFKKDLYYLYQSFLRPDAEVLQVVGKHWYVRNNENDIKVYSNADEVELMINGKSLGRKRNGVYKHTMYDDQVVNNVFYWDNALGNGRNEIVTIDNRGNEQKAVIYYTDKNYSINEPDESLISDLSVSNPLNKALFLDIPPSKQFPVYLNEGDSRETGFEADNSYILLPDILKNSGMIITRRQSVLQLYSEISFRVTEKKELKVYLMISSEVGENSLDNEGFISTGIKGKWRDNYNNPVEWTLFEKSVKAGDKVSINPGLKAPLYHIYDYVVFISDFTTTTGVENREAIKPDKYNLSQNYSNPFNPTTTITFRLPKKSYVNLVVYNALGQEIETLINGFQTAGEHKLTWQPTGLASGIYFYRLQAGAFSETRKLILQK